MYRFTYPHSSSLFYRCTTFARQVLFSVYISTVTGKFTLISPSNAFFVQNRKTKIDQQEKKVRRIFNNFEYMY
jgi:hypothetical protein